MQNRSEIFKPYQSTSKWRSAMYSCVLISEDNQGKLARDLMNRKK